MEPFNILILTGRPHHDLNVKSHYSSGLVPVPGVGWCQHRSVKYRKCLEMLGD